MKIFFQYVVCILIFVALMSCKDEKSTEPEGGFVPDELVGAWNAIKIKLQNQDNPADTADIYQIGARQTIEITANGRFTTTFNFPSLPEETESGVINVEGNQATLDPDGDEPPETVTFTLDVDTLTVIATDQEFDLFQSLVTLTIVYVRD
jgi:hypothetical protein